MFDTVSYLLWVLFNIKNQNFKRIFKSFKFGTCQHSKLLKYIEPPWGYLTPSLIFCFRNISWVSIAFWCKSITVLMLKTRVLPNSASTHLNFNFEALFSDNTANQPPNGESSEMEQDFKYFNWRLKILQLKSSNTCQAQSLFNFNSSSAATQLNLNSN